MPDALDIFGYVVSCLVLIFVLVIFIRGLLFKPQNGDAPSELPVNIKPGAEEHLAAMIKLKTVSSNDPALVDESQFQAFRDLLERLYPTVTASCPREQIGKTGVLYHWKGKKSTAPTVLMAHYDVVPADASKWSRPPFCGEIVNSVLWGRGTLDTKGTLCGILEAAESLLKQGYQPENDVYFSFSGDEEIMGPSAPAIVAELEKRGVHPALVLDEGGAIVEKAFPGVTEKTAMVGVCEKGQLQLDLAFKGKAGHTSAPPPSTAVIAMSNAILKLHKHPFPARLTPAAAEMFNTLGRRSSLSLRLIFANLWCFWPLLKAICTKAGGELNATLRTTPTVTKLKGSDAYNVLPGEVVAGVDVRLLYGDTADQAQARIQALLGAETEVRRVAAAEPSSISPAQGEAWERVRDSIRQTWPEAVVSPYIMVARSDSSNFCKISSHVLRFSAMELSKEERGKIHGVDECVPLEKIHRAVAFFTRVLLKS